MFHADLLFEKCLFKMIDFIGRSAICRAIDLLPRLLLTLKVELTLFQWTFLSDANRSSNWNYMA